MLVIKDLHSSVDRKEILHGINLKIAQGEIHAIMGPNGSGKTTLTLSLMGHPAYEVNSTQSKIILNKKDITSLQPEERAKRGLFVAFQNPLEVTGVSLLAFLRTAYNSLHGKKMPLSQFKQEVKEALRSVNLSEDFLQRSVNEGFSGGEKKRAEIAQLLVLRPKYAILDEIDSGLDIDSLKVIAQTIAQSAKKLQMGILIITHYQRILHYLRPDKVHILIDGRIKKSGTLNLVRKIEKEGYAAI
ncbi:MAG: ABC transporter ATP-binding protein [Patescibacteria group bacterium]|nr:MAG: ABC transporter ATP-binding protein [Patescibacteria group bacterium]